MKIYIPPFCCAWIAALSALGLQPALTAEEPLVRIEMNGGVSISIPSSWKVVKLEPPSAANDAQVADSQKPVSTLLLSARSADSARGIIFSVFRMNKFEYGPGPEIPGMGDQSLTEKLMYVVNSNGYVAKDATASRFDSAGGTPMVTIRITALNTIGEERIFETTAVAKHGDRVYIFASWPGTDTADASDVLAITKSFQPKDAGNTTASKTNSAPSSGSAQSDMHGQSTPTSPSGPMPGPSSVARQQESSTANQPPAEISDQAARFVQDHHNSLIIVEGSSGVGSGFLCMLGGKTFAITNIHVLRDNAGIRLKALNGTVLVPGSAGIAVDHDIVRLEIQSAPNPLEAMAGIDEKVKIGDAVVIPGNSEGAGVVKPMEGKVVGIGPNLIEVDAPFVSGNSGSPIIHRDTGKVIAVATYLIERKVSADNRGSVKVETRRFGYRLDSVTQWEPVNWQSFYLQSGQVAKMETISGDFIKMFDNARRNAELDPNNFTTPDIRKAIQDFQGVVAVKKTRYGNSSTRASLSDVKEAQRRFFSELRNISHRDTASFDSRNAYDYFRRQVNDEQQLRDKVFDIFTQLIESQGR